jgi:hypothetical protein
MGFGWYNTLAQEVGPFRTEPLGSLANLTLAETQFVVVPRSAARTATDAQVASVGKWVRGGGVLLIELPDARWESLTGVSIAAQMRPARQITAADRAPLRGLLRDALLDCPLPTGVSTVRTLHDEASVILEVDGAPGFIHVPRDEGQVYVLAFDLARAVTTMQQGRSRDDFTLPTDTTAGAAFADPDKLISDKKMRDTRVPYADVLERAVLESTAVHTPLPRIWFFPGTRQGAYIASHNEDSFGDRAIWLTDWETSRGRTSTNFITPEMSAHTVRALAAEGHDIQVEWSRGARAPSKRLGIGPWEPLEVRFNLSDQIAAVERRVGANNVTLSRIRDEEIDPHWSSTFRKMAWAGLAADSTYGPSRVVTRGYPFGTTRPFYPLDTNGLLLPVAEVPFVARADGALQAKSLRTLISGSESGFHQVIMPSYGSGTMAQTPSVSFVETWRAMFRYAERHGHWVTTMRDYMLFDEARRSSSLRSAFTRGQRHLRIHVTTSRPRFMELAGTPKPEVERGLCPAVAFPKSFRGEGVQAISLDGEVVPRGNLGRSGDGFYHLITMSCGEHIVDVVYEQEAWTDPSPLEKQLRPR